MTWWSIIASTGGGVGPGRDRDDADRAGDDYLRIPANGLVTNEETLTNDPELVGKMVRATLTAIQYTLDNPDEAFAIALTTVPEAGGDNETVNRAVFDAVLADLTPQPDQPPGATTLADLADCCRIYARDRAGRYAGAGGGTVYE